MTKGNLLTTVAPSLVVHHEEDVPFSALGNLDTRFECRKNLQCAIPGFHMDYSAEVIRQVDHDIAFFFDISKVTEQ